MPKVAVVTGGAGFIGHHLVKRLSQVGYKIIVIDNLTNASKKISQHHHHNRSGKKILFYKEDIRNKDTIEDIFRHEKIDTCIHLAAKVSVIDSFTNPNGTTDVNVKGMLNVLEACSNNEVNNFVFASSAAVYGNKDTLPLSENQLAEPLSPYGDSKLAGEALVSLYKNSRQIKNGISLRFFNVYGEGQNLEYAGVITSFADRLSKGLPPIIYGDGKQMRDFVSVNDVVNVIMLAAAPSGQKKEDKSSLKTTFNVGTGKPTMINELAKMMIRIFKSDLQPIFTKAKKGEIRNSYADIRRLKMGLGFIPSEKLDSALRQIYRV